MDYFIDNKTGEKLKKENIYEKDLNGRINLKTKNVLEFMIEHLRVNSEEAEKNLSQLVLNHYPTELDDSDTENVNTGNHWDFLTTGNEIMTTVISNEMYITELTGKLLEDTGFYFGNFYFNLINY